MPKIQAVVWVCLCLLTTAPLVVKAQQGPDFRRVDSLTYNLYLQQEWDNLITTGKQAINDGYDYYYMQMRVGIAYYQLKNYRKAIPYFKDALTFNPGDQTVMEFLYYSYLFSGRAYDAKRLIPYFSQESLQQKGIEKNKFLEHFYVEGGPGIFANDDIEKLRIRRQQRDSIYSKTYLYDDLFYFHGGLNLRLWPGISTYQGYGRVGVSMQQKIDYLKISWDDFIDRSFQDEYFGSVEFVVADGFRIVPAWHFIWLNYSLREDEYVDSLYIIVADTMALRENDYVLSLSLEKDFGLFGIGLSAARGDYTDEQNTQFGLFFNTYPKGNLSFYTSTGLTRVWSDERDDFLFHQLLGFRLSPVIWMEAETTIGNMQNYVERNAFVVYNTPEKLNFKVETNFLFNVTEQMDLSLRIRYMQRVNEYLTFTDFDAYQIYENNYNYFTFIGGLKWRF